MNRTDRAPPRPLLLAGTGLVCAAAVLLVPHGAWAQPLASLKTVPVPEPPDLGKYVRNKAAAIQLGKALFWDMQLGSDGVLACASCHFHAGADNRTVNQVSPGANAGDTLFNSVAGPNATLTATAFPFHKLLAPDFADSALARPDSNDVTSSQGIALAGFVDIQPGSAVDIGTPLADPMYNINGVNIRRVEPRNTPTVINAVFNFDNFWDGRASNVFNGVNPFGAKDQAARVLRNAKGVMTPIAVRIRNASLASQAVGPPLSDFEMSFQGRTWPKVGKKMLSLTPLAKQTVHAQDSVLGPLANATATTPAAGLNTTYAKLIKTAFQPAWWGNKGQMVTYDAAGTPTVAARPAGRLTTSQYTQMEANFSLFFGLAVQLYEATLVSDDSPFDRFMEGSGAQTRQEERGQTTFEGAGACGACHSGAEFTKAAVSELLINPNNPVLPPNPKRNPTNAIDFMTMTNGRAFYDVGYYNIGSRPSSDDVGRGGTTPLANSAMPGTNLPLSYADLSLLKFGADLTPLVADFVPNLPLGLLPTDTIPNPGRTDVKGAFKTPTLRNVELTGPYMHNGGLLTLAQVVDFYTRGSDFAAQNADDLSPDVSPIGKLRSAPERMNEVVAFLLSLTDERVRYESAPFDHPELFVPNGADPATGADAPLLHIPAVGAGGRVAAGLPPLQSFLGADPFRP